MFARDVTDSGSFSDRSTLAPPLQQDKLATEIVDKLDTQGTLPAQPQALSALVRQTAQKLTTSNANQPIDQDTLAAASQIAMAKLVAARVPNAQAANVLDRQLLSQSLVGIGLNSTLSAADQSTIARLIVDSAAGQSQDSPLSTLGQMLTTVNANGNLSSTEKSVLQNAIIDSDASTHLGAETVKFLGNFVGALAKAQQSPKDATAVATAQFDMFMVAHGDDAQYLSGAALDNEIGGALGMKPDMQAPANRAQAAALLNGTAELYSGKQLDAIRSVADQITKAGGAGAGVTALPVVFNASGSNKGPQTHILWRVDGMDGSEHYVDDAGRIYSSMQDYLGSNRLGYGTLLTARDGHLSIGADGTVASVSHTKHEGFWDKVGHYAGDVVDALAIVGAGVLTVAAFVGTDGVATPLLAAAWSSVLAGGTLSAADGASDLVDRADHGQSWAPGKDTFGDYAGIAAGLATPFTGGAAKIGVDALATKGVAIAATRGVQTGARVVGWTANGVEATAGAYSGDQVVSNWDSLSWSKRLEGVTTMSLGVLGASRQGAEFLQTLGSSAPTVASASTVNPSTPSLSPPVTSTAGPAAAPAGQSQSAAPADTSGSAADDKPIGATPPAGSPLDDPGEYLSSRTSVIWPSSRIAPPDFDAADTLVIGGGRVFRPPAAGELYLNIDPTAGADVVADVRNMASVPAESMNHVYGENVPYRIFTQPVGPLQPGAVPPGIAEIARVLKPGGTVHLSMGGEGWLGSDQFRADLRAAGFVDIQTRFVSPLGSALPVNPSTFELEGGGFEVTATKPAAGSPHSDG